VSYWSEKTSYYPRAKAKRERMSIYDINIVKSSNDCYTDIRAEDCLGIKVGIKMGFEVEIKVPTSFT